MRGAWCVTVALLVGACDLGAVPGESFDAGPPGDASACIPAVATGDSGHHNPNTACTAGCHDGGGGEPVFTAAGTLSAAAGASAAVAGATITITGADGVTRTLISATNGNFYTTEAIAFPATVAVSKCPDTATMVSTISTGECTTGCHVAGGTAGGRVHLP